MNKQIFFSRAWDMPNHETFAIPAVNNFLQKWLTGKKNIIDPFARNSVWGSFTNDLNPDTQAQYHLDVLEFLEMLVKKGIQADAVIFDPPYSNRQMKECYQSVGMKFTMKSSQRPNRWTKERDLINCLSPIGCIVLSFGWNSTGMGKKRGYEKEEILLINHGAAHNDTICLAERKIWVDKQEELF